jgi:ribonuclease HII
MRGEPRRPDSTKAARGGYRLRTLLRRERALWSEGFVRIAGLDEAGVGPLAGPVVAAVVVFPSGTGIRGVDDSKKLLPERRLELAAEIRRVASAWAVAVVDSVEIDRINILRASLEAMRLALQALAEAPDYLLVDARKVPGTDLPQEAVIHGDARCHAIAAASILAKTHRDALMDAYDARYPGYGFALHKGYATAAHRDAIRSLGPCEIHRRSFILHPEQVTGPPLFPELAGASDVVDAPNGRV